MRFLIINGPNINFLGIREPEIYGGRTYLDLIDYIRAGCSELGVDCEFFQSNHEGAIVDAIQGVYKRIDGIIINPAAYTHTSIAILDALKAVGIPAVEVHLSDVDSREDFRQVSYAGKACCKRFAGMGFDGYIAAAKHLKELLS
jgi:3-dehydroquinate dehydratase-2